MEYVGSARPAGGIQRQYHGVLVRRYTRIEVGVYGCIDIEVLPEEGVLLGIEERRSVVGLRLPGTGVVITVDGDEIDLLGGISEIDVHIVLRACGSVERHHIILASCFPQGVQLAAELRQQRGEVLCVGRGRELPINVEAIKQTGSGDARSNIALHKKVDAGGRECLAAGRSARGSRESRSVCGGRASQRDQDLKFGM